jgi:hypothetical protein
MDIPTILAELDKIQREFDRMGNSYSQSNPGVMIERSSMRRRQSVLYAQLATATATAAAATNNNSSHPQDGLGARK